MSKEIKKKRRLKRWVYNILFIIGGAVIGEVVAFLTKGIGFLSWLSYEVPLGITTPIDLNFILFRFQIGFYFVFCPALVLFIALALVMGNLLLIEPTKSSDHTKVTIGNNAKNENGGNGAEEDADHAEAENTENTDEG